MIDVEVLGDEQVSVDISEDAVDVEVEEVVVRTIGGTGDMKKAVYDPQKYERDIFQYTNDATQELTSYEIDLILGV